MSSRQNLLVTTCLAAMFAYAYMPAAHANPLDGTVSAGNATITSADKLTTITQQSDKAIIDWRGFDIGADETTQFIQPNAGSITLNRVHSNSASQIDGHLVANGNIIIINQNGILFGTNANVDVHGILGTTADIGNDQFMNSSTLHFDQVGNANASIINNGTITAHDAGLVGFVAPNVINNGTITATLGRVHLASGDKATVDFYGDGLMEVEASSQLQNELVKNTGTISANGGKVAMTAAAGGSVVNSIINAQGVIHAQNVSVHNGEITIGGGTNNHSHVTVSGTLDASSTKTGGKITITGDNIKLASTARLNASGITGGGTIKIGGDAHGTGPTPTAQTLQVERGAYITNDAIQSGDGGTTILWSDIYTSFEGNISGRGGATGGKGGFVEVSGRDGLHYDGLVDLTALRDDDYGTLLLDPSDITISTGTDGGGSFASGTYTASAGTSTINVSTLQTQLASSNVIINSSGGTGGNGDITVANDVTWTAAKNLTLTATRDIILNGVLTNTTSTSTVTLTGRDITFNANMNLTTASSLVATATRNLTVSAGKTLTVGAATLKAAGGVITNTGVLALNGNLVIGNGTVILSSGLDADGINRTTDLTLNTTNLTYNGTAIGAGTSITGFRDITVNQSLTSNNNLTVVAQRDLTIGAGATLTSASAINGVTLQAAGGVITNRGVLTNNGLVKNGIGNLTLTSGLDASNARTTDLTLDSAHYQMLGASLVPVFTGFRDIAFNSNYTLGGTVTSIRNLTIGTGATITSLAAGLTLNAAGGVATNTGLFINNGTISVVSGGSLTIVNGLDNDGINRTNDLTLNTGNLALGGNLATLGISGFQDINFNRAISVTGAVTLTTFRDLNFNSNMSTAGTITATATRNLTIGTGATLTSGPTSTLILKAANGAVGNTGIFTNNGTISVGSASLSLLSGLDGSGNRVDLTFNSSNFVQQNGSIGNPALSGFRDINLNTSLAFNNTAATTITAARNFTIGTGAIISSGAIQAFTLNAAGGVSTNVGVFTLNGKINAGSNSFTLLTGLDSSSARTTDITLDSTNFALQSGTLGSPTLTGFRDINLNLSMGFNTGATMTALRNFTIGAGATISTGAATTLTLNAAGGVITNIGTFTNNGTINQGTAGVTLLTGLDSSSARTTDIELNASNFTMQSTAIGALALTGFRDITLNRNLTFNNVETITANRNLTISTGATITGSSSGLNLNAANASIAGTGLLTINGNLSVINVGLLSGLDGSGNRADLTLSSANLTPVGNFGNITITGYRDITIARDLTGATTGAYAITAERNLTVNSGVTVSSGPAGSLSLRAAGGVITNQGLLTMNGTLNLGTAGFTLLSGTDGSTGRNDLTLNSGNLTYQNLTVGSVSITGFRDVALNGNMTGSVGVSVIAERDLTIGTGATTTIGLAGTLALRAGGSTSSNIGLFTLNGALSVGTGTVTIGTGLDSSSARTQDITLNTTNYLPQSAAVGALNLSGFRDITLSRNLTFNAAETLTALRNLTISSGATITSGASTAMSLLAAGAVATNIGTFTNNGTISIGTSNLTLLTGLDSSSARTTDIELNTSNFIMQNTAMGILSLTGFRDITLNRSLTFNAIESITANRNLTIGAGATIASGTNTALALNAAAASASVIGTFTNNGTISIGSGALTLSTGLDSSSARTTDLTLDNTSLILQAANMGAPSFVGFRDIYINRNITFGTTSTITANRNLTIGTGATVASAAGAALTLNAAAGSVNTIGTFTNNGTISQGTAALTILTGLDSSSARTTDITLTTGNLTFQGANLTAIALSGFRDITINRDISLTTGTTITANRNLTIGTGVTLSSTANLALNAAGAAIANTGLLNINGTLNMGIGTLTLLSGTDGSTGRNDLSLNSTNLVLSNVTIGAMTVTGFRDITLDRSLPSNGSISITAERNLTVSAGSTLSTTSTGTALLRAAGGNVSNIGTFTLNGNLSVGTGNLTLLSGLDSVTGLRADLTLNNSNLTLLGTSIGAPSLSGFRDITLSRDLTVNGTTTIQAFRNITISAGSTLTAATTTALSLVAANNSITTAGLLTLNGTINMGTGSLTLLSGTDGGTGRNDLTLTTGNFAMSGATIGALTISGFNDILLSRSIPSSGVITVTAVRNLTVDTGVTLTSGATGTLVLKAANGVATNIGYFTNNGNLSVGTGNLSLLSGVDGSGNRTDITLNSTNFTMLGANIGAPALSGFRDVTLSRDLTVNGTTVGLGATRNFTISAGSTLTVNGTTNLNLTAANGAITNAGYLTINGAINMGSGALTLLSGTDGSTGRADFTLTNSNLTLAGLSMGALTISGYNDILLSRTLTSTGAISVTAVRNLTVDTGVTLTTGSALSVSLRAANGVLTGTGIVTINGTLNLGTGVYTLLSGVDGSGSRADYTINATNTQFQNGTLSGTSIQGFRDLTIDRDLTFTASTTFVAYRNLTIATGRTLSVQPANGLALYSANNVAGGLGIFTNNGNIAVGSGILTLFSGVDGSGNRANLTLNNANLTMAGTTFGQFVLSGFNDITIDRNLSLNVTTAITALRNLTVNAGSTITMTGAAGLGLNAANNSTTGTGLLTINGTLNMGTGLLTLLSGTDGGTGRSDLTLDSSNFVMSAATVGITTISGFRNITFNTNYAASGASAVTSTNDITFNSTFSTGSGTSGFNAGHNLLISSTGTLNATAGGNTLNLLATGTITNNGILNKTSGNLTMTSGVDAGNRVNLTLDDTHYNLAGVNDFTVSGFNDININKDIAATSAMTITAFHDLTLQAGHYLQSVNGMTLRAANGLITNAGVLNLNGVIKPASFGFSLLSGLDGSGNRVDLTLNSTNYQPVALASAISITGFRDVLIDTALNSNNNIVVTAERNLTIGTNGVIMAGSAFSTTLNAAGGVVTNTGVFINNGIVNAATNGLTLTSGVGTDGNRVDLTMDNTHFTYQSGTNRVNTFSAAGFRDFILNQDLGVSTIATITAVRDLIINTGYTLATSVSASTLKAANGLQTNVGVIKLNGTINVGTGGITLFSGMDSGTGADLTFNSSNFIFGGYNGAATAFGALNIAGGRDVTIDRDITTAAAANISITATRNLTLNSGRNLTSGGTTVLKAANGVIASTGTLNLNGTLGLSTQGVSLVSGKDSSGNYIDLLWNNALVSANYVGPLDISGFRDVEVAKDIHATWTGTSGIKIVAQRNLTIDAGVTLEANGNGITLQAANNIIAGTGLLTMNGQLVFSNGGGLSMTSGQDLSGNRTDLTIDAAHIANTVATAGFSVNGFRDIFVTQDITSNGGVNLNAYRNLTINSGVTLTGLSMGLYAANNVATGLGVINQNGKLAIGTGALTMTSGQDSSGNRTDLLFDSAHLAPQYTFAQSYTVNGFRDITIATNLSGTYGMNFTAVHNLILNSGVILTANPGYTIALRAANNSMTGNGVIIDNGVVFNLLQNSAIVLNSGLDDSGNRVDFTMNAANIYQGSVTLGAMGIYGFRDININRDLQLTWSVNMMAYRDINIGAGITVGGTFSTSNLSAAGGVITNRGTINLGAGAVITSDNFGITLVSGQDASGNNIDLTLNSSNFINTTANFGPLSISGFRDLTIDRDITASGTMALFAQRNLIINAGRTLTTLGSVRMNLNAANGVMTGTGVIINNGVLVANNGGTALTMTSGIGTDGNRANLLIDSAHFGNLSNMGGTSLSGFRNIVFGSDATFTTLVASAERNFIINSGVTLTIQSGITVGAGGAFVANTLSSNTGTFINNGILTAGGQLLISSGVDSSGNRADLTLDGVHLVNTGSNISLLGFRDVSINHDLTQTGYLTVINSRDIFVNANITGPAIALSSARNLTIASGTTLTSLTTGGLILKAAGGVTTGTGVVTMNGVLNNQGTGAINIVSGIGTDGNRTDLTLNSTNYLQGALTGSLSVSGFNDMTVSRNLASNNTITLIAARNLTVDAGVTLTGVSTALRAANNTISGLGILTMNGILVATTGGYFLTSGVDSSGNRVDFTVDSAHISGTTSGFGFSLDGFRDVVIAHDITSSGGIGAIAQRNLTINAGVTLSALGGITLESAGGVTSGIGVLNMNGNIITNVAGTVMISGQDTSGNRTDLTLNNVNYVTTAGAVNAISLSGFRDINLNRDITTNLNSISIIAERNLTIANGVTVTSANGSSTTLKAGGNTNINQVGILTNNGVVSFGRGLATLQSGVDSSGNRADLTLDSSHYVIQSADISALSFTGFRDININESLPSVWTVNIVAQRNLNIASGVTVQSGASSALKLAAAGGTITNTGLLINNGVIMTNSGSSLNLISGRDGSGNAGADLLLDSAHYTQNGLVGATAITGFRDLTFAQNYTGNGSIDVRAERNLIINSGVTVQTGLSGFIATFMAGGGVTSHVGQIINNGVVKIGNSLLSIISGTDSSGNRNDFVWDNSTHWQLLAGAVMGNGQIAGFRDLTMAADFITNGGNTLITERNLTINAGVTIQSSLANFNYIEAAGGNINNVGILTNNGTISTGTSILLLISGLDSSGNRADYVMNNANTVMQGANIGLSMTGFRDVTIDRDLPVNGTSIITAQRNLTVNAGRTVSLYRSTTSSLTLNAAGGLATGTGVLNMNGIVNDTAHGSIAMTSGVDGSGNRADLTLNAGNFQVGGGSIDTLDLNGFRDITINESLPSMGATHITAYRNFTLGSGYSLTGAAGQVLSIMAAAGVTANAGTLNLAGTINLDGTALTLYSGIDGSGNSPDLTWDNGTLHQTTATALGALNLRGFRDITFASDINSNGSVGIIARRNLTINSGATITASGVSLNAANGVTSAIGTLNLNGTIHMGTGGLSLISGMDLAGNRPDFVWDNATHLTVGTAGPAGIFMSGFRDYTVAANMLSTQYIDLEMDRNLTINNGVTLTTGPANSTTLVAAGGDATRTGILTMNGLANIGTATLNLKSGLDTSGNAVDLQLTAAHFVHQGPTNTNVSATGFRDIEFGMNFLASGTLSAIASRDIIIDSGTTLFSTTGLALSAGRNFINNAGANAIASGGRWLVYSNGPTGDVAGGLTPDFTLNNCSLTSCGIIPGGNGFLYAGTTTGGGGPVITPPQQPDPSTGFNLPSTVDRISQIPYLSQGTSMISSPLATTTTTGNDGTITLTTTASMAGDANGMYQPHTVSLTFSRELVERYDLTDWVF